ncbi:hypothetical protein SLS60_011571 [Paraconiothyrium brasiliense]|uniref:Uncharacterized protein n=1 Tax=Paraconiothyrium brasiliense TaxID=300254 RepID=A0ABR3QIJ2_9PLEO
MSVPSAEDIAELQRECHPFPDYIDFIHGRPTSYERLMDIGPRLENGQCDQAALEHTAMGTLTVPPDGPDTPTPYQLHRTNSSQYRFYNILYKYMPQIYDNITFIKLYPTGNDVPWRRQELIDFEKQFKGLMWNYMMRLVTEMQKTRLTGAAPYTAIPGWLERWNKVRAERAEWERKRTLCRPAQEGEAEQSKGESSPLPQWKGF